MAAVSAGTGRVVSAQVDHIWVPRLLTAGKRVVVLLHGQLQTGQEWNDITNTPFQSAVAQAVTDAGMACASIYGDGAAWGNDTQLADLETLRTSLPTLIPGCNNDKLLIIGASMGGLWGFNYMRAHPTLVAAYVGIMPASDMDDIRDINRGGTTQANINTAWGMPVGSTSGTNALPTRANPNSSANAALIASSGAPIKMYYSTADTIVVPATVTSLATKLGVTPTIISNSLDHGDALIGAAPLGEITT